MCIINGHIGREFSDLIVYAGFQKSWFDFIIGHGQNVGCILGLAGGVDIDRVDLWFLYLRNIRRAIQAVHGHIILITEVAIGYINYILLGDAFQSADFADMCVPVSMRQEGFTHFSDAGDIGFQRSFFHAFKVIDDGGQNPVFEFTLFDHLDLLQQQLLYLFQRLALARHAPQSLGAIVIMKFRRAAGRLDALALIKIQVDQTGSAIVENHVDKHQGFFVRVAIRDRAKRHGDLFLARVINGSALNLGNGFFLPALGWRQRLGLPL